jgi:hypothetical protein
VEHDYTDVAHTSHASTKPSPSASTSTDEESSSLLFDADLSRHTDDTCHSTLPGLQSPPSVIANLDTDSKLAGAQVFGCLHRHPSPPPPSPVTCLPAAESCHQKLLSQLYLTAQPIGVLPDGARRFSAYTLANLSSSAPTSISQLQFDTWLNLLAKDHKYDPLLHRISDTPDGTLFITNEQSWRDAIARRISQSTSKLINFFIHPVTPEGRYFPLSRFLWLKVLWHV